MRTLFRFELSVQVDTLILTTAIELRSGGLHITWTAFDAHRAEEREAAKFYRPDRPTAVLALDERFRRAEA